MEEQTKDPLDELIVNENKEVDKSLLAEILKGHVELVTTGKVNFLNEFYDYSDWKKIMLYMLARKAIFIKKLNPEIKEAAMPKEIGETILIHPDNVGKRFARELKDVIEKNEDGYFIPNYKLIKCKEILSKP